MEGDAHTALGTYNMDAKEELMNYRRIMRNDACNQFLPCYRSLRSGQQRNSEVFVQIQRTWTEFDNVAIAFRMTLDLLPRHVAEGIATARSGSTAHLHVWIGWGWLGRARSNSPRESCKGMSKEGGFRGLEEARANIGQVDVRVRVSVAAISASGFHLHRHATAYASRKKGDGIARLHNIILQKNVQASVNTMRLWGTDNRKVAD
ncbi:hypothetical protein HETIRDRAFT_427444 [Heterobasidion irregulare TC 32-1]|uniref:Uncharacterized protein n=1 Tax=Heterobasidion irregulare (strain TC 32-1) TaxID=747525 RepID=W4K5L8_HETIT|nr:uncharacterized protein HETIRDRAFT_427444 [Heterobasidion irregulare TC 32-1]ETW80316.1 hypothetical protein HETIRDRAFT_427444 [Heterobasidion irregulare TC 32-1]